MRSAWTLCLLLALAGCRYGYTREGSDRFVRHPIELVAGQTTAQAFVEALGPPQSVTSRSGDLILHYRFLETDHRSLIVRYFGGQWLQYSDETTVDQSLIAVFDAQDRLRYVAPSPGNGDRFAVRQP
jgi:hypothetical protein